MLRLMSRRTALAIGVVGLCFLGGCRKSEPPPADPAAEGERPHPKSVAARAASRPSDARHQSFAQATTTDPPPDALRPPDLTRTGKNVGQMFEQIAGKNGKGGLWDEIVFVDPNGKNLRYTAIVQTDLGDVTIELWPDIAPNHVRNFLALARVGYYEGSLFHQTVRQEYRDESGPQILQYLEAGCPLGTGDPGYGSIGYWLKPELHDPDKQPKVIHGEGTVGAWHSDDPASAACRFYITLSKAPSLDGGFTVFGRVSGGLDIARRILARPTLPDDAMRPRDPVAIRHVAIRTSVADFPP